MNNQSRSLNICTACINARTETLSSRLGHISLALLQSVLNLPSLKECPIFSNKSLIDYRSLNCQKSDSVMPSSVAVEGNRRSTASGSSPQLLQSATDLQTLKGMSVLMVGQPKARSASQGRRTQFVQLGFLLFPRSQSGASSFCVGSPIRHFAAFQSFTLLLIPQVNSLSRGAWP